MESLNFECDVVVIGAGLSGLSAAYQLLKKDRCLRVAVLEAKNRIGGRTLTKQLTGADGSTDFFDIGGEWIGRPQPHVNYLLQKFGINTFNPVIHHHGNNFHEITKLHWKTILDLKQFVWKLQRLRTKVMRLKSSTDEAAFLSSDDVQFVKYMEQNLWTQEAKRMVDSACQVMFSLGPAEMSLLYFIMYVNMAGGLDVFFNPREYNGAECRVKGGVQQLCHHLMQFVGKRFVYLEQPVVEIIQSIEGAKIITANKMELLCQRVVMAIPPHHAADISYQPPMPAEKKGLMHSIPLAFLVKFVATYEEPFWLTENRQSRIGFQTMLTDSAQTVGVVYDATSSRGNPALAGFVSAAVVLESDPKNRKSLILRLIERQLGSECYKLLDFHQMDWSQEPFNGGCFLKAFMPGTASYLNRDLQEPFDRIHFAGTETGAVWQGFMNGAVQSGFRAATEVLYHLRPLIVSSPCPELSDLEEEEMIRRNTRSCPFNKWAVVGLSCLGIVYFLSRRCRASSMNPDFFVKNICLVFKS